MKLKLSIAPLLACILIGLAACAGTQSAYKAANSLPDTAYVVAEHYSALLREAADLRESGNVPVPAIRAMQYADMRVKPLIVGDPTTTPATPGLKQLADTFKATQDAKTQEELQRAVDRAVLALSDLMRAVSAARRPT